MTVRGRATLVLILAAGALPPATAEAQRTTTSLDAGWRFRRGEAVGAEQRGFDDAAWQAVDVPHDWSIEGPYDAAAPSGRGGGYLPSGVSWYRRRFALPAAEQGRRIAIELDGVMADARVWVNGRHVGHRPNGYVSVRYDVTEYARFGDGDAGANVIVDPHGHHPAAGVALVHGPGHLPARAAGDDRSRPRRAVRDVRHDARRIRPQRDGPRPDDGAERVGRGRGRSRSTSRSRDPTAARSRASSCPPGGSTPAEAAPSSTRSGWRASASGTSTTPTCTARPRP